jgi:hypothetical protein
VTLEIDKKVIKKYIGRLKLGLVMIVTTMSSFPNIIILYMIKKCLCLLFNKIRDKGRIGSA